MVVAVVVFLILRLTPGDPAAVIAGQAATSEDIERIRVQLGLTQPLWEQFVIWVSGVVRGDLGFSFYQNKPVLELIAQRIEPTLSLAFGTMVLAVCIAIPLGTLAAWRMGGWLDRGLMMFSVAGFSIPVFVIGYLLIYFFSIRLEWLPVQGYSRISGGVGPWMRQLILPWITLAIIYVALIARVTRASVSEALTEDYIRTARAKGIRESAVLLRHALANAAVPIATVVGIGVALLIGGVVVTETVYAIPGLGLLTVDSVLNRDFPMIQGVVLFFSVLYVLINLCVDLLYLVLDPRIRY
jgi:peptide/nickel transport system permease protein